MRFSFTILKSIRLPLKNCMPVRSYPLSLPPPSLPPSLHPSIHPSKASIPLFMAQSDHIRPMGAIDRVTSIFSSQPSISMLFIISRLSANRTQQKQILFKWFVLCEREIKTEKQTSKQTNKQNKNKKTKNIIVSLYENVAIYSRYLTTTQFNTNYRYRAKEIKY